MHSSFESRTRYFIAATQYYYYKLLCLARSKLTIRNPQLAFSVCLLYQLLFEIAPVVQ